MSYDDYAYSLGKSLKLRLERGIGFEEIISLIEMGKLIEVVSNPSEKYPNQFVYKVDVDGYVYLVPFVLEGKKAFLKTIFPSRKATKQHKTRGKP